MGLDKRLKKMEARLEGGHDPAVKTPKELKAEKQAEKQQRREIRAAAAASLDVKNWTAKMMEGDARFSGTVEESVEDKLSKETVGLVTFEELKAKRAELEVQTSQAKRKAEEEAEREADKKKKAKAKKAKAAASKLSFGGDGEEEEEG